MSDTVQHALAVTLRGCEELIPQEAWVKKLIKSETTSQPLRIKLGLDPTAPDIHIGHTVVLNKMRQLQDLGHQVIFLIGDFTSLIGDPSGRNSTRPPLTPEQIKENAETYYKQASLVLDPEKTEIRYNSEWSLPLGAMGMIQLAAMKALVEIVAFHHPRHGVTRGELDHATGPQGLAPLTVVADLGFSGVQHHARLLVIGVGIELDLLGRQWRACAVASRRVADQRGEVTDQKDHLMPQVLQLAHFVEHHGVTHVDVGRGGVKPQFDAQGRAAGMRTLQLFNPFVLGQQFFAAPQAHRQGMLNFG